MNHRAGEYADERTGSSRTATSRAALLQVDQSWKPFVDERLVLAAERGDDERAPRAQVVGQPV